MPVARCDLRRAFQAFEVENVKGSGGDPDPAISKTKEFGRSAEVG
jgi:hypothetical protein